MDEQRKNELKQEIIEKIAALKKNIDGLRAIAGPIGPDRAFGKVGRIDAMHYQEIQKVGLEAAESSLHQLEYALAHIDDRNFGVCACCGGDIGYERIKALPESRQCIRCAKKEF